MNFFFDRCMPHRLARMVDAYETDHTVRHHDDDPRFKESTTDVEWLTALAADDPRWIIVSGDGRILKNRAERAALEEANLSCVCLTKAWMNMAIHEFAWKFLRVWPEIAENAKVGVPSIFEVAGGRALKVTLISRTKR
jgi:hypothetical protein